jgi:hypothetical protein
MLYEYLRGEKMDYLKYYIDKLLNKNNKIDELTSEQEANNIVARAIKNDLDKYSESRAQFVDSNEEPKYKLLSKSNILKHWWHWLVENCKTELKFGIPVCWACGNTSMVNLVNSKYCNGDIEIFRNNWNNAKYLEKHHIVPKSIGGETTSSNIAILYRSCHRKAPTSPDREIFLRWLSAISKRNYEKSKIREKELREAIELFAGENSLTFMKWLSKKIKGDLTFGDDFELGLFYDEEYGLRVPISGLIGISYKIFEKETEYICKK